MYTNFNAWALGLNLSAEASIALAASAGVDRPVRDFVLAGGEPEELRRRMDDLGLSGGAWTLPVDWRSHAAVFVRKLQRTGTWVLPETPDRPDSDADRAAHRAAAVKQHIQMPGRDRPGPGPVRDSAGTRGHRSRVIPYRAQGLPFVHRLADFDRVPRAVLKRPAWECYSAASISMQRAR
jgi:hypothetical protein